MVRKKEEGIRIKEKTEKRGQKKKGDRLLFS